MKVVRTIWLTASVLAFFPLFIFFGLGLLVWSIRRAKLAAMTIKNGIEVWWETVLDVFGIGKEFIVNGINGF